MRIRLQGIHWIKWKKLYFFNLKAWFNFDFQHWFSTLILQSSLKVIKGSLTKKTLRNINIWSSKNACGPASKANCLYILDFWASMFSLIISTKKVCFFKNYHIVKLLRDLKKILKNLSYGVQCFHWLSRKDLLFFLCLLEISRNFEKVRQRAYVWFFSLALGAWTYEDKALRC